MEKTTKTTELKISIQSFFGNQSRVRQSLIAAMGALALSLQAQGAEGPESIAEVRVDQNGTVHIPSYALPPSMYMSEEAKRAYIDMRLHWPSDVRLSSDVTHNRKAIDRWLAPKLTKARAIYETTVEERRIAGVSTQVVTPVHGVAAENRDRVLINLHGGGFLLGAGTLQLLESIPIAATASIKVISIDFRQAPEHKYPAASEDVAAVYRALLKQYQPGNIGIFGHSTGSALAAMSLARFQVERLPAPGAIAMLFLHSGTGVESGGDLYFSSAPLFPLFNSRAHVPPIPSESTALSLLPYLATASIKDPLAMPMQHPQVYAQFPPALLVTSTRDMMGSTLIQIHRQLVKTGVESRLEVWDGMWSGFMLDVDLPESKELFQLTRTFFARHLDSDLKRTQ